MYEDFYKLTNIKNFKVFMHVDRYYYAAHMYKKCLILGLLILISGNVINFTFQFYDGQRIFAQTNQSPEADDQKVSVDANDKIKIILEGKDDDKDDEIKFDIVSDPSHGKLDNFDKSDGTVTYSPEEDYSGDDEFKFKVVDDKGAESNKGSVDIKVEATNQSPEADDQKVSVDANDKIKIILEGKDDDKDDEIKFDIVSDPSHGKLDNFDKSDGTVTYSPEEDYSGDDEFKFKVVDDKGAESNTGDVEITVKSVTETNQQSATTGDETNQQSATTGDETNQQSATTGDETNQQSATTEMRLTRSQQQEMRLTNRRQQQEMRPTNRRQQQEMRPTSRRQQQEMRLTNRRQQQEMRLTSSQQQQEMRLTSNQQQQEMRLTNRRQQQEMRPTNRRQQQEMRPTWKLKIKQQDNYSKITNQLQTTSPLLLMTKTYQST